MQEVERLRDAALATTPSNFGNGFGEFSSRLVFDSMSPEFDPSAIIQAIRSACPHTGTCSLDSVISVIEEVINTQGQRRREMETELRQTVVHFIKMQEEERSRIAAELNDNLAQLLAAVRMRLGVTQSDVLQILDEAIATVRRLGAALRPSLLDYVGLGAALTDLVLATRERADLECSIRVTREVNVGADKRLALYRICQEAIANVLGHAQATKLEVELFEQEDELHLVVTDDGKGFDPGAIPKGAFGVLGIREMLRLFGGTLEINSDKLKGTRLVARVPVIESAGET